MEKEVRSAYVPLDIAASVAEHGENIQGGETCRVAQMQDVFAWMRGFMNAWYGWSNDGKGTFFDFMAALKAKYDGWKFCMYKQEDMDTVVIDGKAHVRANRIYKNLAWSLTGKTWNKNFADKHKTQIMTLDEEVAALEFIEKHFFIINPKDRRYKCVMDDFMFMYEKYGIDAFMWDPWNTAILGENERGDERLINAFIDIKEFALVTNTCFNIVNHPKSMNDVKDKDGRYKVVNQFMQLGGSAWDIKMDGQYSIYRPERHLNPADPKVHFYNLKQRQAEVVGVERGEYTKIIFDKLKKQYYFDGVNPMDGSLKEPKFVQGEFRMNDIPKPPSNDEVPF